MKRLRVLLLVAALSGCSSIIKVEGDQLLNDRLLLKVGSAWNRISPPGAKQPYATWTQEGLALDQLRLWSGVRPGESLTVVSASASNAQRGQPPGTPQTEHKGPRTPTYAAGMASEQLVSLFESVFAVDGSLVEVTKVEPGTFGGARGVRFEFSVLRKSDDVRLRGVGWASVRNGELFAATFVAPRLAFFGRLLPTVESLVSSAQIRG